MYYTLFFKKNLGIDSDSKFFLIKFLQHFDLNLQVPVTSQEMVKRFGMNDRAIKKAVDQTVAKGYLLRHSDFPGTRKPGRPRQVFSIGSTLIELVSERLDQLIHHRSLIEKLLSTTPKRELISKPDSRKKPEPQTWELTNVRKMLLCVLLANADERGVVRDLNMTELAALVGISKDQVRWHLKILRGSKYLFHYISGGTIKGQRGKLKSIFVVRIDWADIYNPKNPFMDVFASEALDFFRCAVHLAYGLKEVGQAANCSSANFRSRCMQQFSHWQKIYHVDEDEYETIVNSADLLNKIGDATGVVFKRVCMLICELALSLFNEQKFDVQNMISKEYVDEKLDAEIARRRLDLFYSKRDFCWLSVVVLKLCREIERLDFIAKRGRKILSFIHPVHSLRQVVIHGWIELDGDEN